MTTPAQIEGLLEKIAKLQALAERAGTPAEAEAAAAKMQQLLLRHNMTAADIDTWRVQRERAVEIAYWEADKSLWKAKLLGVIAPNHLCVAVKQRHPEDRNVYRYVLWGRPENLAAARLIYAWLMPLVERLASEAHARQIEGYTWFADALAEEKPREWRHNYRLGLIDGISVAYATQKAQIEHEDTWGLLPVLTEEVTQAVTADLGDIPITEHYNAAATAVGAYARGFHRGKKVPVGTPQLEGET